MLILTRKIGQVITITLQEHVDINMPVSSLDWPLKILVNKVDREQVKIGVHAEPRFLVQREEAQRHAALRYRAIADTKSAIASLDAALNALKHAKELITAGNQKDFITEVQHARHAIWAAESTGLFRREGVKD